MTDGNLRKFYLSSPMREGVLCWYPFRRGASVLDLSGGALTDMLKERCGRVVTAREGGEKFDYAVCLDPDDFGAGAFAEIYGKLKPEGRMLMAYENPFALRYWNGKASPKTNLPYDPLLGRDGRAGKADIKERLKRAGFLGQKWYYPITDHWFAREIYSEDYLPGEDLNQRLVPYVEGDENLAFDERLLYRDVIRGGAFEFMCGAYLVEARVNAGDEPCPVDYAAVTAYRRPSGRFATAINNDGFVYKTPLHPDGAESAVKIARNHAELAEMGINILPVKVKGGVLVMPRVYLPTLWECITEKLAGDRIDKKEILRLFDRLRDAIYKAYENSGRGGCYWELVPANCFYDARTDEILFFDQEYYWEGASPDIAVARAVRSLVYSPVTRGGKHTPGLLGELKKRYGIADNWDEITEITDVRIQGEVFGEGSLPMETETVRAINIVNKKRLDAENELNIEINRRERFRKAAEKLRDMGYSKPVVYGYGKRGKSLARVLTEHGMEPAAIADKSFAPGRAVSELIPQGINADVIIISIFDGDESAAVKAELESCTDMPVYILEDLLDGRP